MVAKGVTWNRIGKIGTYFDHFTTDLKIIQLFLIY